MATIQSPFPISGSCGDFTFATNGKTNYMKMKNWLQGDRWHKSKEFKRARENAQTFGGAAKVGCRIYSTLASLRNNAKEGKSRKVYRPYAHNFITKRLHKHALKNGRVADHYGFLAAYPALRGLDLSNEESGTALISLTPIGPAHRPHHLKVQGIRDVADNILRNLNGNCTLEVRLQLTYIDYPEARYDVADKEWNHTKTGSHLSRKSPKSAWIPTDFLPEVLSLSLLDASKATDANHVKDETTQAPVLIFLEMEFQEVRASGKTRQLHKQAIIRLAAMHYDEATAGQLAKQKPMVAAKPKPRPTRQTFDLQKALKGLIDEPEPAPEPTASRRRAIDSPPPA